MKISKILFGSFILAALYSCDDNKMEWGRDPAYGEVSEDELPENENDEDIVLDEEKGLKDYITDPNFKFGIGMGMDLFTYNDTYFEIVKTNFNDVAAGYSMKHAPMVSSTGEIQYNKLDDFFAKTKEANMSIFGHCLIWHSNQNRTWLESVVDNITGGDSSEPDDEEQQPEQPQEKVLINNDFESNSLGGWYSWGQNQKVAVHDEGYNSNYSMKLECVSIGSNPKFWDCQAAADFADSYKLEKDVTYRLSFFAKSKNGGTIQIQPQNKNGGNGCWYEEVAISREWSDYSFEYTYKGENTDVSRLALSFGTSVDTYYIDNIKFTKIENTNSTLSDDTNTEDEETLIENAIKTEMNKWISGMITYCYNNANVTCWDVVNEPMDDGNPSQIKTEPSSDIPTDAFYWQDYFKEPREYAYWAFKYAREAFESLDVTNPKLFINDYNLEYNLDKCRGLIAYVNEIETKGCKVDGIATQMHIDINTNKDNIRQMFVLMAETGKLVKISELDVKVNPGNSDQKPPTFEPTSELLTKQAEMYKYVIDTYFEVVPKAQQYGITIWSVSDNYVEHEYWIPNDAPNLWDAEYQPKEAYYSVAKALAKEYGTGESSESSESSESTESEE